MKRRQVPFVAVAVTVLLATAVPAPAQTGGDLAGKRREAQQLEARISEQGSRLSSATEDFNEARLERQRLEGRLARLRSELAQAEDRFDATRTLLGQRARAIYMHPGLWAEPFLNAGDLGGVVRARTFSNAVVSGDRDLLLEIERAKAELRRSEEQLADMQDLARSKESDLQARQRSVETELGAQRQLLSLLRGEIGELVEAERRRQVAEAARRAEAERRAVAQRVPSKAVDPDERQARTAGPVRAGAGKAVQTAAAQIGKPYQWGASGPDSFDCSGLTQYAWKAAGVNLPHSSRAQYASLPKVSKSELQPGDLLFFGDPIHHVGIYEGNGVMVNATETGDFVKRSSIHRRDFTGAARP